MCFTPDADLGEAKLPRDQNDVPTGNGEMSAFHLKKIICKYA